MHVVELMVRESCGSCSRVSKQIAPIVAAAGADLVHRDVDSDLELFAEYGEVVSVKIIMDRETGRSKGYGFVEMADDEAGDKAIAALNEVDMDGKTLSVSVARPREERPRRSYGNNGGGGYRGGNNSRGGGYGGSRGDNGYGGGRNRY